MTMPTLVVLPGLDGTGKLLEPFAAAAAADARIVSVAYPTDQVLGYSELLPLIREALPQEPFVLVAESFSGPLGVMIAAERPPWLEGLVLCASFVESPLSRVWSWLGGWVWPVLFRCPMPRTAARRYLVGQSAPESQVAQVRRAVASVKARVVVHRMKEVLRVDVRDALAGLTVPVWYLAAANDRLLRRDCFEVVRTSLPTVERAEIDGPHLLLMTRPAEVAKQIVRWCDGAGSLC